MEQKENFKDIVKFSSDKKHLLSFDELKKKKKLVEGNMKSFIQYSGRRVLLYDENYSLEEGAIKKLGERRKAIVVVGLDYLYYKKGVERSKAIAKLSTFVKLLERYKVDFFLASLSKAEEDLRTYREKVYAGMLLGLNMSLAKRTSKLLEEVDWID